MQNFLFSENIRPKQAAEEHALLAAIVENSDAAIIGQSTDGIILTWNAAAAEIYGYEAEEMIGQSVSLLIPRDRGDELCDILEKMHRGERIRAFETKRMTKSGKHIFVSLNISPIKNREGELVGISSIARDISDRKQAEHDLMRSEERFRALFENMKNGVAIYKNEKKGEDFIFVNLNRAGEKIDRISRQEIIGKRITDIFPGVRQCGLLEVMQRVYKSGIPEYHPVHYYEDGRISGWRDSYVYKLPGGEIVVIYSDESELKQVEQEKKEMERQLRQAQKMEAIGTLAGGIAHDFNNILTIIIGHAQIMEMDIPAASYAGSSLDELTKAAFRATRLVEQILTFCRHREQTKEPLSFSSVLKEALKFLRSSLPSTIDIRQQIAEGDYTVMGDATQMHQLIMNLCTNAWHAMKESGGILETGLEKVEMEEKSPGRFPELQPGPYLRFTVKDNGRGMSPQIMERIFDPYFTTKNQGEGTGLGLAIVHGIVTAHGGVIQVQSSPGKGSTFEILLPVYVRKNIMTRKDNKLSVSGKNERVLFVDDEEANVRMLKIMLERLGYQVQGFSESIKALEFFRSHAVHFDLIISDLTMPGLTGDRLAEEIRKSDPDIPIVLCTGYSGTISPEAAKAAGITEIIPKPFDRSRLSAVIRSVLDKRKKE